MGCVCRPARWGVVWCSVSVAEFDALVNEIELPKPENATHSGNYPVWEFSAKGPRRFGGRHGYD